MGEHEVPVVLPAPCPSCEGPGYLEFVDVANGVMFEACRRCGIRWEARFGTVAATQAAVRSIGVRSTHTGLAARLAAAGY
jgi:hypothetical protein